MAAPLEEFLIDEQRVVLKTITQSSKVLFPLPKYPLLFRAWENELQCNIMALLIKHERQERHWINNTSSDWYRMCTYTRYTIRIHNLTTMFKAKEISSPCHKVDKCQKLKGCHLMKDLVMVMG
ncbi:hypothetical protein M8C21_005686 [Ambrosia artemisiifolia]|uniref:Uncharacterized protein n=1 Tax=Ambrosia artemisiifolia TaxID=4212 RepID=A0AAD5G173_AMBAR|nr:hypothetical protein M8C21_005686 [Ambrosia artemisiifolia]